MLAMHARVVFLRRCSSSEKEAGIVVDEEARPICSLRSLINQALSPPPQPMSYQNMLSSFFLLLQFHSRFIETMQYNGNSSDKTGRYLMKLDERASRIRYKWLDNVSCLDNLTLL